MPGAPFVASMSSTCLQGPAAIWQIYLPESGATAVSDRTSHPGNRLRRFRRFRPVRQRHCFNTNGNNLVPGNTYLGVLDPKTYGPSSVFVECQSVSRCHVAIRGVDVLPACMCVWRSNMIKNCFHYVEALPELNNKAND